MTPTYLTTRQVAVIFAVHPNTVVSWARTGRLAYFRTVGGHRRYAETDVMVLLAESQTRHLDNTA